MSNFNYPEGIVRQYAETVQRKVRELAPEMTTELKKVTKINLGECLILTRTDEAISPGLNLTLAFNNGADAGRVAEDFLEACRHAKENVDASFFMQGWEQLKDVIYPCLISSERNKELARNVVSRPFLDLMVVYKVCRERADGLQSITVTEDFLQKWGVDEETLYGQAVSNLKNIDLGIKTYGEFFKEKFSYMFLGADMEEMNEFLPPLYVWTNRLMMWGAGNMLQLDMLKEFWEKHGAGRYLLIIPSSVNELMLTPDGLMDAETLRNMVCEVNSGVVTSQEFLSDNVYIYDGLTGQIEVYDGVAETATV